MSIITASQFSCLHVFNVIDVELSLPQQHDTIYTFFAAYIFKSPYVEVILLFGVE